MGARSFKTRDRRIQKTQRALREALISLIGERGWDDFSVQDLCDRADVGRSTFYTHFADKNDVLNGGFEELRAMVKARIAEQPGRGQPLAFARAIIDHIAEQQRAFRALLGKGTGHPVLQRFLDLVVDLLKDDLGAPATVDREAAAHFLAGGFLELVVWWLGSNASLTADEVDKLFVRMATPVLALRRRQGGSAGS